MVRVSRHASQRLKERVGLPKRCHARQAQAAYDRGTPAEQVRLCTTGDVRIFGFVYDNNTLITVKQMKGPAR